MTAQWLVIKDDNAASLKIEDSGRHVVAELLSEEIQLRPCEEVWLQGKGKREEEEEGKKCSGKKISCAGGKDG